MIESLHGKGNIKEPVARLSDRMPGSPTILALTSEGVPDDKRMWEILNVVPLIESNKLTPEQRAEFRRKRSERLRAQLKFQNSLNQTVDEFFGQQPPATQEPRK